MNLILNVALGISATLYLFGLGYMIWWNLSERRARRWLDRYAPSGDEIDRLVDRRPPP